LLSERPRMCEASPCRRFAYKIGTREYSEKLYRISKDEHQRSHIMEEPIGS